MGYLKANHDVNVNKTTKYVLKLFMSISNNQKCVLGSYPGFCMTQRIGFGLS